MIYNSSHLCRYCLASPNRTIQKLHKYYNERHSPFRLMQKEEVSEMSTTA